MRRGPSANDQLVLLIHFGDLRSPGPAARARPYSLDAGVRQEQIGEVKFLDAHVRQQELEESSLAIVLTP